jgi:crotonobetainyl-CoA:carnitine CoA-transferase CaiB-like acyl-CoA transferase
VPAALDGLLVVDFTRVVAGPACTRTLDDFGAEVINVENPRGRSGSRAPLLGEHAKEALRETFVYDDARIVALAEAGAVGTCETPTVVVRDARHNSSHLRDNEPAMHRDAL